MIIGKVKQNEMTLKEFLEACEENERVLCLDEKCFISFDKNSGIKVRYLRKDK